MIKLKTIKGKNHVLLTNIRSSISNLLVNNNERISGNHIVTAHKKSKSNNYITLIHTHNSLIENPENENPEIEKGKSRNQNVTFLKDFHRVNNENPEIKSQYYQSIRNEMVKSYMKLINN